MKISIAMATYNGSKYLKEQLDSFVAQTLRPHEIVVCDDCSSDETVEILLAFAKLAPFDVHVYRNSKNLGYAQNFNKALSLCTGELVFLSDQDDVWSSKKIEMVAEIAEGDCFNQVFMNDAELANENLCPTGLTKLGQIRTAGMLDRTFVMGCCAAIKGGFLKNVLPVPDEYGAHDAWIVNIAEGLGRRRIIEKALQYYRRHSDNESSFIANKSRKINKITYLWHQILLRVNKDSLLTLEQSLMEIGSLINRLRQMSSREGIEYVSIDEISLYLSELDLKKEATEKRLEVLRNPRVRRVVNVVKMLVDGRYKYFYGVKSAIGDVFFN